MDPGSRIPVYEPDLGGREVEYVLDCLVKGWISGIGPYVRRFEEEFSAFCGVSYGIATSSGTTALDLVLAALGIGPGDEVIVPNLTFVATANAVRHVGARPVFVDSDPSTWTIDPDEIEEAISPRTKAIIAVHLYGHPADMDPILRIADRYRLFVIEDGAEAHGALYKGRRVGSLGHGGCFSFYGNKILTTGEGGMIVTDDANLAQRARSLRGQAMSQDRHYWHPEVGYNFRMTNLQAAIGVAQLERIEEILARKRDLARQYTRRLRDLPGIDLPPEAEWATSVFWMYSILIKPESGCSRDGVRAFLQARGIETRPFFCPLSTLPPYSAPDLRAFPVSEYLARHGINLPSSPRLTDVEIQRVVEILAEALGQGQRQLREHPAFV